MYISLSLYIYIYNIYIYIPQKKLLLVISNAFVYMFVNFFSCALRSLGGKFSI